MTERRTGSSGARGRGPAGDGRKRPPKRGSLTTGDLRDSDLPKWVREEISRSTPKERRAPTMALLSDAAHAFGAGKYPQAAPKLREAKALAPQVATIRELLGLTLYHLGDWEKALAELRTFRRISGETTHLAVEMDCLRALGRPGDVEKTWRLVGELGASGEARSEARVVYASHLLDQGRAREAWEVVGPKRIERDPTEAAAREWFVAARAAIAAGDPAAGARLIEAIERHDAEFPGLEELRAELP